MNCDELVDFTAAPYPRPRSLPDSALFAQNHERILGCAGSDLVDGFVGG